MLKNIFLLTFTLTLPAMPAQAASVFYYDSLKIKTILESPKVEAKFTAARLSNGAFANSIEAIEMVSLDQQHSRILFNLKSAGCALVVTLSFVPNEFDPKYTISEVADWVCP